MHILQAWLLFRDWLLTCMPCDRGYYAPVNGSFECLPCGRGFFASQRSSITCLPCPLNSYGVSEAATYEDACKACPAGSYTKSSAQASAEDCICEDDYYRADSECVVCPVGAKCDEIMCAFNTVSKNCFVVGDWKRGSLGRYFLHSCPSGYMLINTADGNAVDPDSSDSSQINHNLQRCAKCDSSSEYIIDPSSETSMFSSARCHKCPKGLLCMGNVTVSPVVAGSVWLTVNTAGVGLVYRLESCPSGYYKSVVDSDQEGSQDQCLPCAAGTECTHEVCENCTECQLGFYKDSATPEACRPCPRNTYNDVKGATDPAFCKQCPAESTTQGTNSTSVDECVCSAQFYRTFEGSYKCMICPAGAMCAGEAGSICSFGVEASQCKEEIIGDWVYNADGLLYLESCPESSGYSRVTGVDGRFNHNIQLCKKCDSRFQFILDMDTPCQECPLGLECTGSHIYSVRVAGSTWKQQTGHLVLNSCPAGYRMVDVSGMTSFEEQRCDFCGMYIHAPSVYVRARPFLAVFVCCDGSVQQHEQLGHLCL
jgi:hypothetical protein